MVMIALKLILFFLSEFGYFIALERKTKINRSFIPMVTVSSQVCVLFFGGILNLLKPVSFILYFGGFYFLLRTIYLNKGIGFVREYLFDINYIFLITMSILCIAALHGKLFGHYDNFSHWALITKQMMRFDRLPNYQDTVIVFQDYPPASALFIYFFCKFVSGKEWLQMFAQAFMDLAFVTVIFSFLKNKVTVQSPSMQHDVQSPVRTAQQQINGSGSSFQKNMLMPFLYAILFANFVLIWFIHFNNLLVDNLLALSGAGLLIFIYYYIANKKNDEETENILWGIPISVFCMLTKNSGLLYCAVISIWLIFHINKKNRNNILFTSLSPYIAFILWKSHCKYVFMDSGASKHALDFASYAKTFGYKDHTFIWEIIKKMVNFSVTGKDLYTFILVLLITGVIFYFFFPELSKKSKYVIIWSIIFYIVYEIGLLCMYIFSMPVYEASYLAESDRYRSTYFITIYTVISLFSISALSDVNIVFNKTSFIKNIKYFLSVIGIFGSLIFIWRESRPDFSTIFTSRTTVNLRLNFERVLSNYSVNQGKKYLLLFNQGHSSFEHYLLRYLYYTTDVTSFTNINSNSMTNGNNYDYIFNYDDKNQNVMNWIRENYPEQIQNTVIKTLRGIDEIDEYLDAITNPEHLVIISVNDEAASNLSETTQEKLRNLGLQQDWTADMVRNSYIAVIYQGEVQEMSGGRIYLDDQINDEINYEVVSAGFNDKGGPIASIRINDIEYSKNKRGINIVVYNPINQTVIDSVNFDTYLAGNPVFR